MLLTLTPQERALLIEVRVSDEDHGGLDLDELGEDEIEVATRLLERGLVEATNEYGEAPDGEEDEREAGGRGGRVRMTARGVQALHAI
ncbi:MAG: hypothetical protein ABI551_13970 [Polyangiaceae bacterium]